MDKDSELIDHMVLLFKRIKPSAISSEDAKLRLRFLTRAPSIKFKLEEYINCQTLAGQYGSKGSPSPTARFAELLSDNPSTSHSLEGPKMRRIVDCINRTTGRTKHSARQAIEQYRLMKKGTVPVNRGFIGEFFILIRYAIGKRHDTDHVQGKKVNLQKKQNEVKPNNYPGRRYRASRRIVVDASSK